MNPTPTQGPSAPTSSPLETPAPISTRGAKRKADALMDAATIFRIYGINTTGAKLREAAPQQPERI